MKKMVSTVGALAIVIGLAGCSATGEKYQADVYSTSSLNTKQEAKTVEIIAILDAKVVVDNSENQEKATKGGGLLGAVLGAVVGDRLGRTVTGAAVGGVTGALSGSLTEGESVVQGVSLTYREEDKTYTSTQVAKKCQFKPGIALMITTKENETRIQPNAECPKEA